MGKHRVVSTVLAAVIAVGLLAIAHWFFFQRDALGFTGFVFGLVLAAVVGVYLCIAAIRARSIERLFDTSIHDLRVANDRLEQQKSLLESILDNLGDGVAVADKEGRLTLFNPAAEDILGLGRIDSGPSRLGAT